MKEFQIRDNEAGQRFDKYLSKLLRNAPKSFFYKMLRKKNITLNGKKATGNEKLEAGDTIKLFLSDETFDKKNFSEHSEEAWTDTCQISVRLHCHESETPSFPVPLSFRHRSPGSCV